ncbi:hypothetical protein Nepgr_021146 [Nepenthes gracilis]|uniref:Thioredoxin domain-containing protein n=1 Tax=Nepenthes gracilis TaxID=150966 RepID=A0AAD3XWZ0_NEPGR|nr:hypothetical protein Nepgr_021146 [Nepenthes gracilis]
MGSTISALFGGASAAAAEDSSTEPSSVISFHSSNRWELHYSTIKDSNQLMVIDFAASWCGPCKLMEPAIQSMASKFSDVEFAKIDVDELPDVAREFEVQAMPTFVLVKRGKEVDRVLGARKDELETKIVKHRSPQSGA